MGEVGLPTLVGLGCLEAEVGALGAFAWFRGDQPRGVQDPADRRGRGGVQSLAFEVPRDRDRAGVVTGGGEGAAEFDNPFTDLAGGLLRARLRSPRSWVDSGESALTVAGQKPVQMLTVDAVLHRRCGDGQLPGDNTEDRDLMLRHAPTLSPMSRLTCRLSPVA